MENRVKLFSYHNSAHAVVSIDDLLLQILCRLSIKSLSRFKLVSKHWLSLIADPKFCHLRSSSSPGLPVGLFLRLDSKRKYQYDYFSSDSNHKSGYDYVPICIEGSRNPSLGNSISPKDPNGIQIEDSCNGLFLCSSKFNRKYYVYNPTTGKFSVIPKQEQRFGVWKKYFRMSLAFDPVDSPHWKLVCLRRLSNNKDQIEIYSAETRSWTVCGEPFSAISSFKRGVYWNWSMHWMDEVTYDIFYFNIEHHLFDKMPHPSISGGFLSYCDMIVSGGHFHTIESIHQSYGVLTLHYIIYELKPDYSDWFIKYQLDLSHLSHWHNTYYFNGLSLVRGRDEEESFLVLEVSGRVIRYNIVSDTVENLYEF